MNLLVFEFRYILFEWQQLNTPIELAFRSNRKVKAYRGNTMIGVLTSDSDGFLKSNKIYYLGYGNHYAAITEYGLLYLNLDKAPILKGELYVYYIMNKSKSTLQLAMVSIKHFRIKTNF